MSEIPLGSIDRLIRKSGMKRVNLESSKALRNILEEISGEIIEIANHLVLNRNKTVINKEDIKLAFKMLKEKW